MVDRSVGPLTKHDSDKRDRRTAGQQVSFNWSTWLKLTSVVLAATTTAASCGSVIGGYYLSTQIKLQAHETLDDAKAHSEKLMLEHKVEAKGTFDKLTGKVEAAQRQLIVIGERLGAGKAVKDAGKDMP